MTSETSFIEVLIMALVVGAASGSIGAFIVVKRMALVGDALSHVALPGIALALAYAIDPFFAVVVFLLGAGVMIWWLERKTKLPTDALVGLLFTASLAIGILTIPDHEIIESLFGAFPSLPPAIFTIIVGVGVLATIFSYFLAPKFLFTIVSPDLAKVQGIGERFNLALLVIFVLVVALGIKLVGTLLMGALTIIPAAIARNITKSMRSYMIVSTFLGSGLAAGGVLIAKYFGILPGPTIILAGIVLFIISLFWARKR